MIDPPDAVLIMTMAACGVGFGVACYVVSRSALHDRIALLETQLELALAAQEDDDVGVYPDETETPPEHDRADLLARIRAKARELAAGGREITTDDIHEAMPLPAGIDGRILTAAFRPRGDWLKVGYTPSRRTSVNHGRVIARWRLKQKPADRQLGEAA